ncbi:MAG: serine hydrolase [Burkholderiales bacterium]|nr:serine hydrolase [Burkholderiales bacterium]
MRASAAYHAGLFVPPDRMMVARRAVEQFLFCWCLFCVAAASVADPYFPPPGTTWQTREPAAVGIDAERLAEAVRFAVESEVPWLRDVRAQIELDTAKEPFPEIIGVAKPRGGPAGMVIRHGYLVAQWGDPDRVDHSFSVAKSYLSTLAGMALDRGLIGGLDERVGLRVTDGGFDSPHNAPITWRMLLSMTSEWTGTLWDKPDVADRRRGYFRTLATPGTFWEYNDVRVNRLALSLLRIWQRPLPDVLRTEVMEPIGAGSTWQWHGYFNSFVDVDGRRVPSVSGGSHWGGGMLASTRDHARFGYLMLRGGEWNGRRIVSSAWIETAKQPVTLAPYYGLLWWRADPTSPVFARAPAGSFFALGAGGNVIWVYPQADLVVVCRWLDVPKIDGFVQKLVAAVGASER